MKDFTIGPLVKLSYNCYPMTNKKFEAKSEIKGQYIGDLFGVPIFSGHNKEVLNIITKQMDKKAYVMPYFVVTLNTEMLVNSEGDSEYKAILKNADLLVADTNGLRFLGVRHIYPGRKLVKDLLKLRKHRVFYLGGWENVARAMAKKYGGVGYEKIEDLGVVNKINKYNPDLLLVAYGGGAKQEKWIASNLDKLKAKVVIGVGGTFNYLTGKAKLPPVWMERLGLEWAWRLYEEPWRWKRQLKLIRFLQIYVSRRLISIWN